ncbi:acyl-CoA dehydrogenase family protein [Mycetocola zhujimingii]|uniref:acyl-CoA dehydrogenase family protein n=1 Tax=Mycetocola zhujimingii TaxID=2079792 RepID=UPI000D339263|nr:acyl-CoA dehydrogenase family protein [Mycetocola zhujimingii]AWB85695.1 acyl-CoA dehydrogenase [Mycetocola zhujimingii]
MTTLLDTTTDTTARALSDDELSGLFAPVFERIREGAVEREAERALPFEAVAWLKAERFGAVRVPREYGGFGATVGQLARLLSELGAADSNLPQLLRGHFAFVETRLVHPDAEVREKWLRRVAAGDLVGNASSELTGASLAEVSTVVSEENGRFFVTGKKYYSTGTIFADWVSGSARDADGGRVSYVVRTDDPGVERLDDWDGFGQRLTGSGTTIFDHAEVDADDITRYTDARINHVTAFFQLVLVATLAGIGKAVLTDTVEYVRPRTRTFITASNPLPREDPLVQSVVGEVAAASFTADALVASAAAAVDAAYRTNTDGTLDDAAVTAAEIAVYSAQVAIVDVVLAAATRLFEVGGASAASSARKLDRHWRNARTVSSHNPVIYKKRTVGEFFLNDRAPNAAWKELREAAAVPS